MKLKSKITSIFIFVTGLFLIIIFIFIYFFFKNYTNEEFHMRLNKRAIIAAQTYLAKDNLNIEIYEDVRQKHLQTLPNEKEIILPKSVEIEEFNLKLNPDLPLEFFKTLTDEGYAEYDENNLFYNGLLYKDNEGDFIVVLAAEDLYGEAKLKRLKNILIFAFFISLIIITVLGQYYAKKALNPINDIITRVNNIKAKNLHLRLEDTTGNDELAKLARTFNEMLDRLQISFDLQSNFINNASHELRNPLTAILGQTEIALNKERSQEVYKCILQDIKNEAQRLDYMVNGLLNLAQMDSGHKRIVIDPFRIDEILLEIKGHLDISTPKNNIVLDFSEMPEEEDQLIMLGSKTLIKVALGNILENACKFSENKPVLLKLVTDQEQIKIIITDEGIGIPEDDIKNIYEPFYRASNARSTKGFGFGLPLAYRIIKIHNGVIKVSSQVNKGTIVKISFYNQKHSPLSNS